MGYGWFGFHALICSAVGSYERVTFSVPYLWYWPASVHGCVCFCIGHGVPVARDVGVVPPPLLLLLASAEAPGGMKLKVLKLLKLLKLTKGRAMAAHNCARIWAGYLWPRN